MNKDKKFQDAVSYAKRLKSNEFKFRDSQMNNLAEVFLTLIDELEYGLPTETEPHSGRKDSCL
jgi:hypothetical protein